MKSFNFVKYKDGGYSIGEIGKDNYITGLGYTLWPSGKFGMGSWTSSTPDGWVFHNFAEDGKSTYLVKYDNGKITEGINLTSTEAVLYIGQTDKNGKDKGYCFMIGPDGSWIYRYQDETNKSRAVEFKSDKKLYMVYYDNGEPTWLKELDSDTFKDDYSIPQSRFESYITKDVDFDNEDDTFIKAFDRADAPVIYYDKENDESSISTYIDGQYHGVIYYDNDEDVTLTQYDRGKQTGPWFCVSKELEYWEYKYAIKSNFSKFVVFFYPKTNTLEIRNFKYSNNKYDCIQVDGDFNVTFIKKYDYEKEECEDEKVYKFDDINGSDEGEVEEKPKLSKGKQKGNKTTKKPAGKKPASKAKKSKGYNSNWLNELKGILKKK